MCRSISEHGLANRIVVLKHLLLERPVKRSSFPRLEDDKVCHGLPDVMTHLQYYSRV